MKNLPKFRFMFFIEMKCISKSVCCLVMENIAFSNPHLRKHIFKYIINESQENQKKQLKQTEQSKNIETKSGT